MKSQASASFFAKKEAKKLLFMAGVFNPTATPPRPLHRHATDG
jgi:hypothetical protein